MAQQTPYIGSKISLISKLDIRYEGILYTVDSKESTIALSKVRSFGTEDRAVNHVVPPQDDVYDYIIFKANDIKDLIVCEMPKPPPSSLPYDPAILSVSEKKSVSSPVPTSTANQARVSSPVASRSTENDRERVQRSPLYQKHNNQNRPARYDNRDGQHRNNQHRGNQSHNRGYRGNQRNGHRPRQQLKFDSDYDFEKANEQFRETLDSIVQTLEASKLDVDDGSSDNTSIKEESDDYYNKSTSFFDNISCEAREKEEGKSSRPDWRKERLTNQETFGQQSVRSYGYRRGNSYHNNRYRGNSGSGYRGGYHNRQGGNKTYRNSNTDPASSR
uniref:Uncharacterized protein n=1 Tax=Panagrolaimus sp. JU765 TaxID=591449 RepID=A0AC34PZK1_9BILA